MRISNKQLFAIRSLKCERLSSNEANLQDLDDFLSKNESMTQTLQGEAYKEDEENNKSYYIVKNKENDILFFFSLKCGMLYDEFIEGEQLQMLKRFYELLFKRIHESNVPDEEQNLLQSLLETVRSKKGLKKNVVQDFLGKHNNDIDIDKLFPGNQHTVDKTYPGIELVHFCKNLNYEDYWEKLAVRKPLGAVVFWQFIVPIVLSVMKIVGCEYLFLFAADTSDDMELVNYYRDYLEFENSSDHQAAMPLYDLTCQFMYQKVSDLAERRLKFFEQFNPEADAV